MYTLTKRFRFEAAHRLAKGYVGKCSNIHGHSWNGEIKIGTTDVDKFDMSVDFYDMGTFVKRIEESFDHKIIIQEKDEDIIDLCRKHDWAMVILEENPTCEALAKYIHSRLELFFKHKPEVKIISVKIEETCTTSCTYGE